MNLNKVENFLKSKIQHYNHKKYWKYRERLVSGNCTKIIKLIYMYRIKKMDAFNNASMGTNWNKSAIFHNRPILPHGLNGIIVSQYAEIGKDCCIFHQVTIGAKEDKYAPKIGDNVTIYPGVIIVGGVNIGNNVQIGAGSVVVKDVPDNCVVAGCPAKIIKMNGDNK